MMGEYLPIPDSIKSEIERSQKRREIPEGRDVDRDLFPLVPNSPREQHMVQDFKEIIAFHMTSGEGKTTMAFIEDLALELWQRTRA